MLPLPAETSREAPKCCAWQHRVRSLKCCPCQQKRAARLPSAAPGSIKRGAPKRARVRPEPELLPLPAETSREAPKCWRLVSAGRGSTSGSGRYNSAFRGPPPFPRGSFLLAGAALQALDGARARFRGPPPLMLPGAALGSLAARFCWQGQQFRLWTYPSAFRGPPLDAARRSTWQPRGSFLLAGAALQAPYPMLPGAALGSLAARFCWQGQHFRLWTVPERVSGPPPP